MLKKWGLPFLGFVGIQLAIASQCQDFLKDSHYNSLWGTTASQFRGEGMGDNQNYIYIAQYFLGIEPWNSSNKFRVANWPPVLPLLVAGVIKVTGENDYFAKMLFLTTLFLAAAFTVVLNYLPFHRNRWVRFALLSLIFFLPNFKAWTLGGGYLISEPYAIAAFLVALVFGYRGIVEKNDKFLVVTGIFFGLSALIRNLNAGLSEYSLKFLLAFLLVYSAFRVWVDSQLDWRMIGRGLLSPRFKWGWTRALLVLVVYSAVVFPWKLRNYLVEGYYMVATHAGFEFDIQWYSDKLLESSADFMHTTNTACKMDPNLCQVIADVGPRLYEYKEKLVFLTFFTHPFAWLTYKAKNLNWWWIGMPWKRSKSSLSGPVFYFRWFEGLLYVVAGIWGICWLASPKKTVLTAEARLGLLLFTLCFTLANAGIFTLCHYEDRYSLFERLLMLFLLGVAFAERSANQPTSQ